MRIDEVSLVDRDANGYADMIIAKRDDSEEQMPRPQSDELTFSEEDLVYDDDGNAYLPLRMGDPEDNDDGEDDSGDDEDDDLAGYDSADDDADAEQVSRQVLAGLSKALGDSDRDQVVAKAYGEISKAQRRAERAEQVAKAERDLRLTREYIGKAEQYSLPVPAEVLGPVLKRCTEVLSKSDCEVIAQCLDAASDRSYDPYSEIGKSGGGDNFDILTQVDAAAEDMFSKSMEAGTGFSREQTISKVFEMNPAAYDQYLAERRGLGRH
jgi:hypothetical protein